MDTWDYVILAFEFVYYIFVAYYIVEEVLEIIKIGKYRHRYSNSVLYVMYFQGWSYFSGVWNNLDILVLILCVMNISLNVYTSFVVSKDLQTLLQVNNECNN